MLFSFFSPYCWTSRCWLPRGLHVAKTPTCISEVSSYGRHFQIQMSLWSKLMTCGWCGRELEETQVFSESYTLTSDPVTFLQELYCRCKPSWKASGHWSSHHIFSPMGILGKLSHQPCSLSPSLSHPPFFVSSISEFSNYNTYWGFFWWWLLCLLCFL